MDVYGLSFIILRLKTTGVSLKEKPKTKKIKRNEREEECFIMLRLKTTEMSLKEKEKGGK